MTQAFNLSQFANRLNTSGQIDPTDIFSSALPISEGGSNNASLAVTSGGVIYTDGSKFVNTGAGTAGQILQSNGSSAPTWVDNSLYPGSSVVLFTSTGNFTVPSGISRCIVYCIGGAGGGNINASLAGGNGGYAVAYVTGLTPLSSITCTVGTGGNTATTTTTLSGAGTASSFGSYVSASGGSGTSTNVPAVNGTGTVSIGTAIIASTAVTGSVGYRCPWTIGTATPTGTTPFVYSGTGTVSAGVATSRVAGVGGAVIIQY